MGLYKEVYVTEPPVQSSTCKYSDRGQPPTMSENESENVLGGCPGESDEMDLEVALRAIIEEHQAQSSAPYNFSNEADPDLDALKRGAEIARSLATIASCVG